MCMVYGSGVRVLTLGLKTWHKEKGFAGGYMRSIRSTLEDLTNILGKAQCLGFRV